MTAVEFALIAPVMIVGLMGLFDLSYHLYADTMVEGAAQQAARDSTIEAFANNPDALDAAVTAQVRHVLPTATITFQRSAYENYTDVGQAEDFTDTNGDGICADNEPFEDVNGNGVWDADRASSDSSGARDAVLYQVTATYDRMFPLPGLLNLDPQTTVTAVTVLRNQPFNFQEVTAAVGNCP
ncbi:hypothetical protein BMF35_a1960 [Aurantiacibacter gangjinensis]|nr:hypothetical protein BMF35_a1960 [Aurantiacibacter gangjinensis]